jgi:hypothetical protein
MLDSKRCGRLGGQALHDTSRIGQTRAMVCGLVFDSKCCGRLDGKPPYAWVMRRQQQCRPDVSHGWHETKG